MKTARRKVKHPAPFSDPILERAAKILDERLRGTRRPRFVLDPFAGVGKIHLLPSLMDVAIETFGVELMPKWAATHPRTFVGDATDLDYEARQFHAVVTSPCYGNRMADHHNASDWCSGCNGRPIRPNGSTCRKCGGTGLSPRRSYRHDYEASGGDFFADAPIEKNAGAMHFGDEYRNLHYHALKEMKRVLKRGGTLVLNMKNHMKDEVEVDVCGWWRRAATTGVGFRQLATYRIPLRGNQFGANREARVDHERVYVFERP